MEFKFERKKWSDELKVRRDEVNRELREMSERHRLETAPLYEKSWAIDRDAAIQSCGFQKNDILTASKKKYLFHRYGDRGEIFGLFIKKDGLPSNCETRLFEMYIQTVYRPEPDTEQNYMPVNENDVVQGVSK